MLAYGESISVARSFAQKHGHEIDPERELTAIGMANLATGLFRGFPVGGGMSQTAINDMGGAQSPLSLIVTSGAIALTILFFAGLFHDLPEPVLGAIVLMAAKHLVKVEELKVVRAASRAEFRIALIALLGVLVFGLLDGLLLAALGSLIVLIALRCATAGGRAGARSCRPLRQSRTPVGARGHAWSTGAAQRRRVGLFQFRLLASPDPPVR